MKKAEESFESANILSVEVGTTGLMGGNAGHGGETYLKLTDDGATSWFCKVVDGNGNEILVESPESIFISVQGDTELETFASSLEWAARKIRSLAE